MHILRYINNASGHGLIYEDKGNAKVVCYSDADWAGSPSHKKSTSRYCVLIGGNLISWRSLKRKTIAKFSAMAAAASERSHGLGNFSNT